MASVDLPHNLELEELCDRSSFYSGYCADSIFFSFIIVLRCLGGEMVLTIQGKVPLALNESKENITWHQQVKRLQNGT